MARFGGDAYENTWYITVRSYGFAGTLVDLFGLGMGIIAGICFSYGLNKKKIYIILSIFIMIAGTLNARTTVIIYLISIVLTLAINLKKSDARKLLNTGVTVLILLGVFKCLYSYIEMNSSVNPTASWIKQGINEFTDMVFNGEVDNSKHSFASMVTNKDKWELPKEMFRLFFGTGHSRFVIEGYLSTDIGYVNDIWFIGITGVILVYGSIVCVNLKNYIKTKSKLRKFNSVLLIASFLVFNIKGCALSYNPGAATIFLIMFTTAYYVKNENYYLNLNTIG
jgi:hypothetical protein